ncbi:MAG: hypothetical protein QOH39_3075 [Verrucomicrobiota bacterium]
MAAGRQSLGAPESKSADPVNCLGSRVCPLAKALIAKMEAAMRMGFMEHGVIAVVWVLRRNKIAAERKAQLLYFSYKLIHHDSKAGSSQSSPDPMGEEKVGPRAVEIEKSAVSKSMWIGCPGSAGCQPASLGSLPRLWIKTLLEQGG